MVNIFSFFTGRNKSKRTSWAGGVTAQPDVSHSSAVSSSNAQQSVRRQTTKFLSLRTRSSARLRDTPKDLDGPRRSAESVRRKSSRKTKSIGALPHLELDFGPHIGADLESEGVGQSLGLERFGQPPKLNDEELEVIRAVRLNVEESKSCWDVFGKRLKETGCGMQGLMLPQHHDTNSTIVHYLLALFLLHHQPALAPSFPIIQSHISHLHPAPLYSDLLESALQDQPHAHELCQILVFSVQHISPSQSSLIDTSMYTKFVQAEHAASYPLDAYTTLFLPHLPSGVGAYLDAVFDVFSAIASKSEDNMVTGGKLCLVLGRWVWGVRETEGLEWDEVYRGWQVAGRRMEHLFYAWIRSQSTKTKLPTRLLELVETYPFGDSTLSSEHLPAPPPSTFPRQTLHVKLETTCVLDDAFTPAVLLSSSLSARSDSATPLFLTLTSQRGRDDGFLDHILAYDSQAFLRRFAETSSLVAKSAAPATGSATTSPVPSTRSANTMNKNGSFRSSVQSHSPAPPLTPLAELSEQIADLANGHAAPANSATTDWDDFRHTGFGDATFTSPSKSLDLQLSPKDVPLPLSPLSEEPEVGSLKPSYDFDAVEEHIIELDDAFLPFAEETQLAGVDSSLSLVCLVRLSTNVIAELDVSPPVEWLLLTVKVKPPVTPQLTTYARGPSPSRESTMSRRRFSLGGLASTFRRSASGSVRAMPNGAPRRSIFGGTSRNLASELDLHPVKETDVLAPELGSPPAAYVVEEASEVEPIAQKDAIIRTGPAATPIADWHYVAEGGANLVFGYHGSDAAFKGRALRIPKASQTDEPEQSRTWRHELLPRLLPKEFLPDTEQVNLDLQWVTDLLKQSAKSRPLKRLEDDHGPWTGDVRALLLDDLRSGRNADGDKVLAVEIKPKWGFLPPAEFVIPAEAADIKSQISRYRLHQHLRGRIDQYEPLDLYSGEEVRMETAVAALWAIWQESEGAANNWRVFMDDNLVQPHQLVTNAHTDVNNDVLAKSRTLIVPALLSSGVFERLRHLQSHLDATDISHLAHRFGAEHPDVPPFDRTVSPEPTAGELRDFIDKYLADPESGRSGQWSLRESMIAYSLSAIFKDCSVFLTLPLVSDGRGWRVADSGGAVKVIDLDLKPLGNMRKWYDLDEEVWRYWHDTHPPTSTPPASPGQGAVSFETPRPLRAIPDRLHNASTDALFVPTPDRAIEDPIDSQMTRSPTQGPPGLPTGPETSSTRALFSRTPEDSRATTPTGEYPINAGEMFAPLDILTKETNAAESSTQDTAPLGNTPEAVKTDKGDKILAQEVTTGNNQPTENIAVPSALPASADEVLSDIAAPLIADDGARETVPDLSALVIKPDDSASVPSTTLVPGVVSTSGDVQSEDDPVLGSAMTRSFEPILDAQSLVGAEDTGTADMSLLRGPSPVVGKGEPKVLPDGSTTEPHPVIRADTAAPESQNDNVLVPPADLSHMSGTMPEEIADRSQSEARRLPSATATSPDSTITTLHQDASHEVQTPDGTGPPLHENDDGSRVMPSTTNEIPSTRLIQVENRPLLSHTGMEELADPVDGSERDDRGAAATAGAADLDASLLPESAGPTTPFFTPMAATLQDETINPLEVVSAETSVSELPR